MNIIITGPALKASHNVSGISAVVGFIITKNKNHRYIHFSIGKKDSEKRGLVWLLKIVVSYFKWIYLLATVNHKLVHFNLPIDKRAIIRDCPLIILTKFLGVKMILHTHGGAYLHNDNIPNWAHKLLELSFKGNNPIIVLGNSEAEFLKAQFHCRNIIVLPNSIDLDIAALFNRESFKNEKLDFLYLGRISSDKGIDYIYEAFKILKEKHALNFNFYIAGKGPDQEIYVNKFKALLKEEFIFKGIVFGEEKIALLKKTNVFLLPSFFEGLPISLLEAMAYAQVPITTNVGSIKYVVKNNENGFIVEKKSTDDIVNAILKISTDVELRNKLSIEAKKTVFTNYSPEKYINALNGIYNYE